MPFSGSVAGVFLLTVGDTDIIHLSEVLMLLWQDAALTVEGRWRTGEHGVYFQVGENAKAPNPKCI